MPSEHQSLGQVLSNMLHAVVSILTTGSWRAEEAADRARSTGVLLDRIPEAAEQDAERVLEIVNDALTSYGLLEARLEATERNVEKWSGNVSTAVGKYKACPAEQVEQKAKLEVLVKSAIKERKKAEAARDQLKAAVDESKEAKDAALKAAEQAGFQREAALSQTEVLRIQDSSAVAQQNLADAAQNGSAAEASKLLDEAKGKVLEHIASARASKQIADVLPMSADQVEAELDQTTLKDDVDAEFAALIQG